MAKEEPPDSVRAAVFIRGCWCRGSGPIIVQWSRYFGVCQWRVMFAVGGGYVMRLQ